MTQPDKQLCKTMTHHDKQFKSSEQLFKHTVHDSLSKHCSGQLIKAIIQEHYSGQLIKAIIQEYCSGQLIKVIIQEYCSKGQ